MNLKFIPTDEAFTRSALAQKKHLRDAADCIEVGSLEGIDLRFVADVLRDAADRISLKRARKPGNPQRKFDHGWAALRYAILTRVPRPKEIKNGLKRLTHAQAIEQLAQEAETTTEAITKALKAQDVPFTAYRKTNSKE